MLRGSRMELVEQFDRPPDDTGHLPRRAPRRMVGLSRPPMSAAEVTQWQAYEQETGPLGAERDDILAAMVAYYVVTGMQGKKSKARLDKMLPKWAPKRPEGWESMKTKLMALTRAAGGQVVTRDR